MCSTNARFVTVSECLTQSDSSHDSRSWSTKRDEIKALKGFTILELLTVMGVIGILAALVLPAVNAARESARRVQCQSQLHQIGLALHAYHEQHRTLPIGWQWEPSQQSAYGWLVALLPYTEQPDLYLRINRNTTLQDSVNQEARGTSVDLFVCPSDITLRTFPLYPERNETSPPSSAVSSPGGASPAEPVVILPTANYVGVFGTIEADDHIPAPPGNGSFVESEAIRFSEFDRGLSSTLIVGERTMSRIPSTWLGVDRHGEDAACRLVGSAMTTPNCSECDECEFGSRHPGGAMFLWGDGHVGLVSDKIDTTEYRRLARRSD